MKNEFGVQLDRNGYAPSIIPNHGAFACWNCGKNGSTDPLNRHEVFGGAYREKSKRLGLWVHLCHTSCHQGKLGVHNNWYLNSRLKTQAQRCAMQQYHWTTEDFIREFGKNYL